MKYYYQLIALYGLFLLSSCSQKNTSEATDQDTTKMKDAGVSVEESKIRGKALEFAKKWKITTHHHPGSAEVGDKAAEGEHLYLYKDATYEMNIYGYKEVGEWNLVSPHPYRYEAMDNMDLTIREEEEVLELHPSENSIRKERAYVLSFKGDKLSAVSTFDPTAFDAIVSEE